MEWFIYMNLHNLHHEHIIGLINSGGFDHICMAFLNISN